IRFNRRLVGVVVRAYATFIEGKERLRDGEFVVLADTRLVRQLHRLRREPRNVQYVALLEVAGSDGIVISKSLGKRQFQVRLRCGPIAYGTIARGRARVRPKLVVT